jgi:hypothetical protein
MKPAGYFSHVFACDVGKRHISIPLNNASYILLGLEQDTEGVGFKRN